jgi:nucleotide-binding universal stress UspA family protein
MYSNILVPYDDSPAAERAGKHAIELAETCDGALHGLYVQESAPDAPRSKKEEHSTVPSAEQALEYLAAHTEDRSIDFEKHIAEGDPATEIVDFVENTEIDLIVLGTRGRQGLDRLIVGSVAEEVIRTAPVPVTTLGPVNRSATESKDQ